MRRSKSTHESAEATALRGRAVARRRPVVEEIEPRILYSADFSPALLGAAPVAPVAEQRIVDANGDFQSYVAQAHAARQHELVFVDTATPDYQGLVDDIRSHAGAERQVEVILLDRDADGIREITDALSTRQDITAVHLISHGADGQIDLGNRTLNFASLLQDAAQIKGWGKAFAPGADLLIYGCDVAQHADGRSLVDALARLTGADVAASEDLTGAAGDGGDWALEYQDGRIETPLVVSPAEQAAWNGILDATSSSSADTTQTAATQGATTKQSPTIPGPTGGASTQAAGTAASATESPSGVQVSVASTPLSFEENVGQADAQVDFLARGSGYAVGLAGGDAVLALQDGTSSQVVRLDVVGKNASTAAAGDNRLRSTTNYLVGSQDQWRTDIANFGTVRYDNIYDGIDLRYYGNQRQLEYDFVVNPGANVGTIQLKFEGVQSVSVADNGDLVLTLDSAGHSISFKAPVAYQDGPNGPEAVASHYTIAEDGTVGFDVSSYDASRPLVIDPVLAYATYFGGTGNDAPTSIAVDPVGNVYLTGFTASTGLPGGLLGLGGLGDAFVAKFSPNLGSLIYSTYVGGTNTDQGDAIAVDASGNAYVTGLTSSNNFPTVSAYQSTLKGTQDVFAFKLNPTGTALLYSTYLGGTGSNDYGWGIAIDGTGSAYVTGVTTSSSFPITAGAADTTFAGGSEAFVTKLSPSGNALVYSTFLGGSSAEIGFAIAVDAAGNAVVVGETASSTGFPTTANAFQATYGGGTYDVFVTKLNSSGTGLLYSSYLGSTGADIAYNVALGNSGKIYLTGETSSTNFATTLGAFSRTISGTIDAFVSVIDPSMSGPASLAYSTYLGGSNNTEAGLGIGVDAGGRIYVSGQTDSTNFPATTGAYQTASGGKEDAFVVLINPAGSGPSDLVYGTYFGGSKDDYGDTGVYSNGKFYLAGDTLSSAGIATAGGYDTSYGGSGRTDAFVAVFNIPPAVTTTTGSLAYVENAGARVLDAGLAVSDPGVVNLAGATLQITGNYVNGQDVLAFDNLNSWGITGTWDAATASLALVGSSSVANYQSALRSVTYQNTSENPSTANRTVTIVASDGVLVSAPSTRLIAVTPVNDPPANVAPGAQSTNEDTPLVFSAAGGNSIAIGDVDVGSGAMQVSLSVTNGVLSLASTTGLTFVTGSGTGNTAMTFTGTLSNINAALDGLRFDPAANFNGAATLQVVTNDQGNTGTGGPHTATNTAAINVVPVNDPPMISTPGPQSTPQNPGALLLSSTNGNAISISDVDAGAGDLQITLTAPDGTLTLGPTAGLTSFSGAGTGTVVITGKLTNLNAALNGLTFAPGTAFTGATTLTIATSDEGNTGLGGPKTATTALSITVSPDVAPTVNTTASTLGYVEDDPATPVDASLTVTDLDSLTLDHAIVSIGANYVNGEDVLSFTDQLGITGNWNAATGTLTLTGAASPADYQTALRSITYQNLSNDPSTAARTVAFVANDSIADGGVALRNIDVTAINDPPLNTVPVAQITNEDTALVFSAASGNELKVGDPDAGSDPIQVTLNASSGTLTLAQVSGLSFGAGANGNSTMTFTGTLDDINAALNGLSFDPAANYNGPASIQIVTNDLGNSGTGVTAPAIGTVAIAVAPVNDAPQGAGNAVSTPEDTTYVFAAADFGFSDPDDNPANGLLAVQITALPTAGTLTNNAMAVTTGQSVSVSDIAGGKLRFTPAANASGIGYASFAFQVQDDGGTASGGVDTDLVARTMTIDVTAVDDAPVNVVPPAQSTPSGVSLVFSSANGNPIVIDDVDAGNNPVQVTLGVTNGTLTLGATAGLTFGIGTGTGDATMSFSGTLADLNAALDGLTYMPANNYSGMDTLNIVTDDQGNTGSGGPLATTSTAAITVNYSAVAVTTSAGAAGYTEKSLPTAVDAGLTLSAGTLGSLTGATVQISGNYANGEDVLAFTSQPGISGSWNAATGTLTLSGTASVASYQTALQSVSYQDTSNNPSTADRTVIFTVNDGVTTQSAPRQIVVTAVDDAPTLAAPSTYSAIERTVLNLVNTGITVGDIDANSGIETLTLSVASGVLGATAGTSGVTVANSGTASLTLTGTIAQLNDLLAGNNGATLGYFNASYNPPSSDTLTLLIDDGGNTGGGPLTAAASSTISIAAVDNAPVNIVPGAQATNVNTPLVFSAANANRIFVFDLDANGGAERITLSVSHGTLSLSSTTGLTLVAGANGSASMTYRGTLASLDAALNGLTYTPAGNYSGADTLTISSNDLGNTGSGGPLTSMGIVDITINVPAPPPVVVVPPPPPPAPTPPSPSPGPSSPTTPPAPSTPAVPSTPSGSGSGASGGTARGSGGGGEDAQPVGSAVGIDPGFANARVPAQATPVSDVRVRGAEPIKVQSVGPAFAAPTTTGLTWGGLAQEALLPGAQTETLTISSSDPEFMRAPDMAKLAAYRSTLGNKDWVGELDRMRETVAAEPTVEHRIVGSTVAVTGAMSVGYVIWLLRGGLLLSSLLSSLPAWHTMDPMPVLARSDRSEEDGEDDDPLETLFGRAKAAIGLGHSQPKTDAGQSDPTPETESRSDEAVPTQA